MGSPRGADLTTRTGAPGTIPISISRKAMLAVPSTETTSAKAPLGILSSVTNDSPFLDETRFQYRSAHSANARPPASIGNRGVDGQTHMCKVTLAEFCANQMAIFRRIAAVQVDEAAKWVLGTTVAQGCFHEQSRHTAASLSANQHA
jgi:hypothetical protein